MFGRGLKTLSLLSVALIVGAFALVFFYAPNDADQGFIQKIFYLHVPLAIVALFGFVAGGVYGIRYLRIGRPAARPALLRRDPPVADPRASARSSPGSIWAQGLLGRLVDVGRADARELPDRLPALRLLPAAAVLDRGLRSARRATPRSSRSIAGAFVPLNFMAVRMAESLAHPRVLSTTGGSMPGSMRLTFLVSLLGMACCS